MYIVKDDRDNTTEASGSRKPNLATGGLDFLNDVMRVNSFLRPRRGQTSRREGTAITMRDFYHYFLYQWLVIIPVCYMSWTHVLAVRESGTMEGVGDEIWEVQRPMSDAIARIIN